MKGFQLVMINLNNTVIIIAASYTHATSYSTPLWPNLSLKVAQLSLGTVNKNANLGYNHDRGLS